MKRDLKAENDRLHESLRIAILGLRDAVQDEWRVSAHKTLIGALRAVSDEVGCSTDLSREQVERIRLAVNDALAKVDA